MACELSHVGSAVDPGDMTLDIIFELLLTPLLPPSSSVLMFGPVLGLTAFQFAEESIVTSSTSVFDSVFRIAHMYWSISIASVTAGLLESKQPTPYNFCILTTVLINHLVIMYVLGSILNQLTCIRGIASFRARNSITNNFPGQSTECVYNRVHEQVIVFDFSLSGISMKPFQMAGQKGRHFQKQAVSLLPSRSYASLNSV